MLLVELKCVSDQKHHTHFSIGIFSLLMNTNSNGFFFDDLYKENKEKERYHLCVTISNTADNYIDCNILHNSFQSS